MGCRSAQRTERDLTQRADEAAVCMSSCHERHLMVLSSRTHKLSGSGVFTNSSGLKTVAFKRMMPLRDGSTEMLFKTAAQGRKSRRLQEADPGALDPPSVLLGVLSLGSQQKANTALTA